jgi:ribonuclease P protein component
MGNFRFQKEERLNRKKVIDELFKRGSSRLFFPLKIIFLPHPESSSPLHQILITIPMRNFKRAADRNTLKRRIREGYRLHKTLFPASPAFCLAYIYIAKEILPSAVIHQSIRSSLEQLKGYEKKN